MEDIANAAGVSRACVYRYYGCISELFEDIVDGFFLNLEDDFKNALAGGASYTDCLNYIINTFIGEIPDKSSSMVMAMAEYCRISGSTYMDDAFRGARRVWADFIRGGISTGEFKNVDADGAAELVIISYLGARMCAQVIEISGETSSRTMLALKEYLLA